MAQAMDSGHLQAVMVRDMRGGVTTVRDLLRRSLWEMTPRDHWQTQRAFRRRQLVCAVVVVVGAVVLGVSLRFEPGSRWFYLGTLALALVWTVGAFASGPLHLGRIGTGRASGRPILQPLLLGAVLAGVFCAGAFVVRLIPPLADQIRHVLAFADQGAGPLLLLVTVLNGIAEELFFRGALYAAIPRRQVVVTTIAYTIATAATGNIMLAFAAVVLGVVVGLQRRASGGILAPIITHLVWSVTMLYALPAILL